MLGLLVLDYTAGLLTTLPAAHIVPIMLAAWYSGFWTALGLGVAVPVAHVAIVLATGTLGEPLPQFLGMTALRGAAITLIGLWFMRLSQHEREIEAHVRTLEGLLHICSFCKRVRNERGEWEPLEKAITSRSDTQFSHGYCPDCIEAQFGELEQRAVLRSK